MDHAISPTRQALKEALDLSAEILADVELSRVAPVVAALKASRLARLLNDPDHQQLFVYEAGGYPKAAAGIEPAVWRLLELAGRVYQEKDSATGTVSVRAFTESIDSLTEQLHAAKIALGATTDRNVSVSSSNPNQFVMTPAGNSMERTGLQMQIAHHGGRLASRRAFIYEYAVRRHYELKFSDVADDVFSRVRSVVDERLGTLIPQALQQFAAVHDALQSENPENWANAVHSCRRILQAVADSLFPPSDQRRVKKTASGTKEISLGPDAYINRLVCYVEDRADSDRFKDVVGSHLGFLGDRLDAVFHAAQKGSHASVSSDEAHRYVVYTYMVVGDILSLGSESGGAG